jgi:hypothetical protein
MGSPMSAAPKFSPNARRVLQQAIGGEMVEKRIKVILPAQMLVSIPLTHFYERIGKLILDVLTSPVNVKQPMSAGRPRKKTNCNAVSIRPRGENRIVTHFPSYMEKSCASKRAPNW